MIMVSPEQMDIFFATSFSGHMDYETGCVRESFKNRIESLLASLRKVGKLSVCCAMEAEGWKISQQPPGVSMTENYKNIKDRPVFLALVDKIGSDGRGLEIEHAYNSGSQVFLATGPGEELSWSLQEIVAMGRATHLSYQEPHELAEALVARIQ